MKKSNFILCINNKNEDDLTMFKVYRVLAYESANKDNYLKVIDDTTNFDFMMKKLNQI